MNEYRMVVLGEKLKGRIIPFIIAIVVTVVLAFNVDEGYGPLSVAAALPLAFLLIYGLMIVVCNIFRIYGLTLGFIAFAVEFFGFLFFVSYFSDTISGFSDYFWYGVYVVLALIFIVDVYRLVTWIKLRKKIYK